MSNVTKYFSLFAYYVNHTKFIVGRNVHIHELPQLCYNFSHSCASSSPHNNCIISRCCTYPKSIKIMAEGKISFSCAWKLNFHSFTCGVHTQVDLKIYNIYLWCVLFSKGANWIISRTCLSSVCEDCFKIKLTYLYDTMQLFWKHLNALRRRPSEALKPKNFTNTRKLFQSSAENRSETLLI